MVVYARSSDPRTGVLEYQLTNISRAKPPGDLFVIPPDYVIRSVSSDPWITLEPANSRSGVRRR